MKLNRNKGNLQSELQKMLQAGRENVESEPKQEGTYEQHPDNVEVKTQQRNEALRTNKQTGNGEIIAGQQQSTRHEASRASANRKNINKKRPNADKKTVSGKTTNNSEAETRTLNAAQRHEVPDRNAKYAGEPIKSVGCRMPQSLYARMLQYKAVNDSQLNRITLNDIIIEAVERFMDEQ